MGIINYVAPSAPSKFAALVKSELNDLLKAVATNDANVAKGQPSTHPATEITVDTIDANKLRVEFQTQANDAGKTARVLVEDSDGKVGTDKFTSGKRAGQFIPTGKTRFVFGITEKHAPRAARGAAKGVETPASE